MTPGYMVAQLPEMDVLAFIASVNREPLEPPVDEEDE